MGFRALGLKVHAPGPLCLGLYGFRGSKPGLLGLLGFQHCYVFGVWEILARLTTPVRARQERSRDLKASLRLGLGAPGFPDFVWAADTSY